MATTAARRVMALGSIAGEELPTNPGSPAPVHRAEGQGTSPPSLTAPAPGRRLVRHGNHCVGTARQYSGTLGRVDRCQVIPSLHAAGPRGSFCLGAQLYLPQSWIDDPARLQKAQVPPGIVFETKWQQMLGLIDRMLGLGLEALPFVGDAGYGDVAEFRRQLTARQRLYLLEVMSTTAVWAPGTGPQPPEGPMGKKGRPRTQYHDAEHLPLSVTELALSQTEEALVPVRWKNGDGPERKGRFAALRLQPATGHCQGLAPEPEQWLVWEWPEGQELPEHYWLSTLPADTPLERLVYLAKLRWRVERDYQEMKPEVGLDHYEGRTWPGLYHHWVLCSVAHGFLVLQRAHWQRQQEQALAAKPEPEGPLKNDRHGTDRWARSPRSIPSRPPPRPRHRTGPWVKSVAAFRPY